MVGFDEEIIKENEEETEEPMLKNQFIPSWKVWRKYVEQEFQYAYEELENVYNAIWDVQSGLNSLKMYIHQIKLTMPDYGNTVYLQILTKDSTAYNATNADTAIAVCGSADSPIPCTGVWRNAATDTFKQIFTIYKGSEQTLSRYTINYFDSSTGLVEATPFFPVVTDLVIPAFTPPQPIS